VAISFDKLRAHVIDAGWLRRNVNCRAACPVHTNAQGYIEAIAEGDFDRAYDIARLPNPFVNICARICGHPCEFACRRGVHDKPLSIRALKRAAADHSLHGIKFGGALPKQPRGNKRVAVVGSGPGGVTAAHDLTLLGYDVALFEASDKFGGMLYLGIPEYRLPRDLIKAEIENLLSVGVRVFTKTRIGQDVSFDQLRHDYQAVFLAVGAQKGRNLRIEGIDADGVINGIDFLLNVNLGYKVPIGNKVVVIGGGNVAMDVARTAAREAGIAETEEYGYEAALDVARSALRMGAAHVHLVALEAQHEMPAYEEEVVECKREGIVFHNSRGPKRVVIRNGKCAGLETVKCLSVFDSDHRFNPVFEQGSEEVLECETILLAIGQQPDLSFLGDIKLDLTPAGFVKAHPKDMSTNVAGIYVGGDVAFGARTAIEAVADGRRAAHAIHRYLSGEKENGACEKPRFTPLRMHKMPKDYDRIGRAEVPVIPLDRRTGITEVEQGYTKDQAQEEASRCLKCNRYPMVQWDKCVLCGGCVDICPYGCLKIVPVDKLETDGKLDELAKSRHSLGLSQMKSAQIGTPSSENVWYAMLKDDEKCTRCGLCVERCPVDAMFMGKYQEEGYDDRC